MLDTPVNSTFHKRGNTIFTPSSITSFRFLSYDFDESHVTARLRYSFDDSHFFVEEVIFQGADIALTSERREALDICLKYLHLVAGISYYKAAVPDHIVIENTTIDEDTAIFLEKLYVNGLGEFAYRNQIDLRGKIHFPFSKIVRASPSLIKLPRRTAIPVGGGKDSIVTMESLNAAGEPIVLLTIGDFQATREVMDRMKVPAITVIRKLSPLLLDLNNCGALNGHVPISAIIAFTLAASAVLYGFDTAAMSNERSANIGNLNYRGWEINHQYSKSLEFERSVSEYLCQNLLTHFRYFSFLRPLSELAITRLFARYTQYHRLFTSCNRAFRMESNKQWQRWCLDCDKCRFVFLALAPFISKEELIDIFGANLLNDPAQIEGYDALTGLQGHKPFECVGECEESQVALMLLQKRREWSNDLIVQRFCHSVLPNSADPDKLMNRVFDFSHEHLLPPRYEEILHSIAEKNRKIEL